MHSSHLLLSVTLLALPAVAQGIGAPSHFTGTEANTWNSVGVLTSRTPSVWLAVYDDMQGVNATLKGISFRRDYSAQNSSTFPAFSILANVWVSTAATTAATVDATFSNNHGPDKKQVSSFALVQFAQTDPTNGIPRDFEYTIPFQQPLNWTGGGPLCIEVQVQSRTNTSAIFLDWVNTTSSNPAPVRRNFGTGCKITGSSSPMSLTGSSSGNWTGGAVTLTFSGSRMPPSTLASILIGVSNTTMFGLSLPLELPGTAGAPSGACTLYNDQLLTIPALVDPNGRATLQLGLSVTPGFNGLSLFAQAAVADAPANGFGVVLSGSVEQHIVAPWAATNVGTVYADGAAGPTGTVRQSDGYVVRFET